MKQPEVHEGAKIAGTVRVYSHPAGTVERINALIAQGKSDEAKALLQNTGKLEVEQHNMLMQSPNYGLDLFIQALIGVTTFPLTLSFAEIGTGATAPTTMDTALTAPTNRAFVTFQQNYGSTDCILNFIYSDSQLANETYYEFGVFCGGTSTIGSGQLFNHALFSTPYIKTAGQDTTVQMDFSFS
jgi:hypothetical protein